MGKNADKADRSLAVWLDGATKVEETLPYSFLHRNINAALQQRNESPGVVID
jgi:hypothetical protein